MKEMTRKGLWAAISENSYDNPRAFKFMLRFVDPNWRNAPGQRLLHRIIQRKHLGTLSVFFEDIRVDITVVDQDGISPLHDAARYNNQVAIKYLIAYGANVEVRDKDGRTPLCWAALMGNLEVMHLLMGVGQASRDTTDDYNNTILHYAAGYCTNRQVLDLVLGYAHPNQINCFQQTPLHTAVNQRNTVGVRALLEDDRIQVASRDSDGRSALDYAIIHNYDYIYRWLLDLTDQPMAIDTKAINTL